MEQAVRDLPGADELTAVREDAMLPMLLNFTEPPTPLSVDGLERIVETFAEPGRAEPVITAEASAGRTASSASWPGSTWPPGPGGCSG